MFISYLSRGLGLGSAFKPGSWSGKSQGKCSQILLKIQGTVWEMVLQISVHTLWRMGRVVVLGEGCYNSIGCITRV